MRLPPRLAASLFALLGALTPLAAEATVPSTMSYQGVLTNDAGQPLPNGNYSLTFRLYAVATGGAALWSETQPAVALSNGVFSVTLGSVTPLALNFDTSLWLGVSVGVDPEMSPRTALAAAPYALGLRTPLPGIASARRNQSVVVGNVNPPADALFRDLDVEIAVPALGYVVVYATGFVDMNAVPANTQQFVMYQISETTGLGALTVPSEAGYYQWVGFGQAPNAGFFEWPVGINRAFGVDPGVHRFSFCSGRLGSFTPNTLVNNLQLIAIYYPISYGLGGGTEVGAQPVHAQPAPAERPGPPR